MFDAFALADIALSNIKGTINFNVFILFSSLNLGNFVFEISVYLLTFAYINTKDYNVTFSNLVYVLNQPWNKVVPL